MISVVHKVVIRKAQHLMLGRLDEYLRLKLIDEFEWPIGLLCSKRLDLWLSETYEVRADVLEQPRARRGPRAGSGPRPDFVRPARCSYIIMGTGPRHVIDHPYTTHVHVLQNA